MTDNSIEKVKWVEIWENLYLRITSVFDPVFLFYFAIFLIVSMAGIWIDFGTQIRPEIMGLLTYGIALSSTLLSDLLLQDQDTDIAKAYSLFAFFVLIVSFVLMYFSCKNNDLYFAWYSVVSVLIIWSFTYSIDPKFSKKKKAARAIGGNNPTADKLRK